MRGLIFPPVNPLTPYTPQLRIVLQQSHTHVAVPRHTLYIGTHALGLIFLGFQDRSEVGSEFQFGELKATLHAPVFTDKVMCAAERNHLQRTHFYTLEGLVWCLSCPSAHTRTNRLYVIAPTCYSRKRPPNPVSFLLVCLCMCGFTHPPATTITSENKFE